MSRMTLVLSAAVLLAACGGPPLTPSPTPLPSVNPAPASPAPPPIPPVVKMVIGEEVKGSFHGGALAYEFTAPADGWLSATLEWDVGRNGSLLTLDLGSDEHKGSPPFWSPLQASWPVRGGETIA